MISILYVDDEPGLLDVGKIFLERDGQFTVETVTSATLALEAMRTKKFDAIISDYQMPEVDGIEFLKRVRASGNTIPFIIFTGRGREEIVIQALNEGADFYLQKGGEPVSQFAELVHKVRKAVLQRRAETSVRDHERREVDIINFLPDATFAIDAKGTVITWNLAMERMTGVRSADIVGKGDFAYSLPFYHERRPILIDLVLHDNPATTVRYPFIRAEGKRLFSEIMIPHFNDGKGAALWFTASPLYDGQGNVIGAIESIREITERKRTEEALNESERRFRELADLLPQVVYEADAEGVLAYANRIAFDLFGYTREEFTRGLTILQMIAPVDRQRAEEALRGVLDGTRQMGHGEEYLARRKDGDTFPVSIYSSPVIRDGKIKGHRGIIIDITASRKAEEALFESEEKYRLVVENSNDAIYIHRGDRLIFVNRRASELSGYTADELLMMDLWDLVHPDDRARLQEAARRRFAGKEVPAFFTARIITKSGEVRDGGFFVDMVIYQGTPAIIGIVRDITEEKLAEAAIRESEERYRRSDQFLREVINGASEGIIVYDRGLRITLWNRFMEEMTGIPAADIAGKRAPEIFSFLVEAGVDSLLTQALAGATVTSPDIRFRIPSSGREGWSQAMYSPHYGAAGEIIGVIGIVRDISRQKRAEEARQQSEVRFRSLIQNASDMIHILDRKGRIVYESPSAEKIMGCPAGANTGKDAMALVHPDDRERVEADLRQVYDRANTGTPTEFRLKKADGTCIWVEAVATNLLDLPAVNGIVVTTRPIEQRKSLETAFRESEARYRNVVEDQTEFICRFLPDGTHVFVNGAYCRYFGLDRERILGTRFKPAIPPDDGRRLREFFASLTPAHPVDFIEHRSIMPDGTTRWQRWSDRAIFDATGKLIEYQSVGRDTTETRAVQEAPAETRGAPAPDHTVRPGRHRPHRRGDARNP
jgi:PAS domain S-box-containing protein